jgi:putative oxidoreductase
MQWFVLALRIALGIVFLAAGGLKVGHADVFASEIAGFQLLWHPLIAPLALLLPFLELMIGVYLVLGLFTRFAAWFAAAEMALFAGAIAAAVLRGISTSCGCFGPSDTATTSWPEVGRDLGFAAAGIIIALCAPGALALDRRMAASHDLLETKPT